jgi:Tol biopolymer transport system component
MRRQRVLLVLPGIAVAMLGSTARAQERGPVEGPIARRVLRTADTQDMLLPAEASPDGRRVAYVNTNDGGVYVRDVVSGDVRQVASGLPNAWNYFPVWSPDGRRIAFSAQDQRTDSMSVKIVAVETRDVTVVPDTRLEGWIDVEDWSADGRSLLCDRSPHLALIAVEDGATAVLADSVNAGKGSLSPDGRFVAYATGDDAYAQIVVQPVAGGARRQITATPGGNRRPTWAPDGRAIAYQRPTGIWVVPMAGGEPNGDPRPAMPAANFTLARWTRAGVYYAQVTDDGQRSVPYQVAMNSATGRPEGGGAQIVRGYRPDSLSVFAWSPEMGRIAYGHRQSPEVTITSLDPASVVTWDLGRYGHPRRFLWLREGREIYYEADVAYWRGQGSTVLVLDASTGRVRELFPRIANAGWFSLSADARTMSFYRRAGPGVPTTAAWPSAGALIEAVVVAAIGRSDGTVVATAGAPDQVPFSNALRPVLTLQGDRVLFVRQAPIGDPARATPEASSLWVVGSDGRGARRLVAAAFIQSAIWDPTGRFIAYTAKPDRADGSTVARVIEVATGVETEIPLPEHVARTRGMFAFVRAVDWSSDGTRLGMIAGADLERPWGYWVVQGLLEDGR